MCGGRVGLADPVGLVRLLRTHADLLKTLDGARVGIVANRVRASVLGIDLQGQVWQTLDHFAGNSDAVLIDNDPDAADTALLTARPVPLSETRLSLSRRIAELADALRLAREPAPARAGLVVAPPASRARPAEQVPHSDRPGVVSTLHECTALY